MFKIFSRQNQINKPPVLKPNSYFGFLCLMALKSLRTREKAGGVFSHKDKPLNRPPYQYWINKQIIALFIISLLSSCEPCPTICFAESVILKASWYSIESLKKEGTYKHSKGVMANGETFSDNAFTCACNTYRLGTLLLVTAIKSGRSVVVRTTDRTSRRFKGKRIDLSRAAMEALGGKQALTKGLIDVNVEVVK